MNETSLRHTRIDFYPLMKFFHDLNAYSLFTTFLFSFLSPRGRSHGCFRAAAFKAFQYVGRLLHNRTDHKDYPSVCSRVHRSSTSSCCGV